MVWDNFYSLRTYNKYFPFTKTKYCMKIGIDISQLAYQETGVANYLSELIKHVFSLDNKNEYVLFYSSLRKNFQFEIFNIQLNKNIKIKKYRIPLRVLDILWNKLHILPIEWFIGNIDLFITSDWTEPPTHKAKKATILYDLIIYKYPKETSKEIVSVQKRKLGWVKKESDMIFCISDATRKDAEEILHIDKSRLSVIYPGVSI